MKLEPWREKLMACATEAGTWKTAVEPEGRKSQAEPEEWRDEAKPKEWNSVVEAGD